MIAHGWVIHYLGGPKDGEPTAADAAFWTDVDICKPPAERFVDRRNCCISHHYLLGVYIGARSTQDGSIWHAPSE